MSPKKLSLIHFLLFLSSSQSTPVDIIHKDTTIFNYDSENPPSLGLEIQLSFKLISFDGINIGLKSYDLQFELTMSWKDTRLKAFQSAHNLISIPRYIQDTFWLPNVFLEVVKDGQIFDSNIRQPQMNIDTLTSTMIYIVRYKVSLYCDMDFSRFPLDTQVCPMTLELLPLTHKLKPAWNMTTTSPAEGDTSALKASGYELVAMNFSTISTQKKVSAQMFFIFEKKLIPSLISIYIPSSLLIVTSFASFWITPNEEMASARTALCVTILLATITLMSSVRKELPQLSYLTALDIWFVACLTISLMTLIEFAAAYTLKRAKDKQMLPPNERVRSSRTDRAMSSSASQVDEEEDNDEDSWWSPFLGDIDLMSRFAFPLLFLACQVSYWVAYGTSLLDNVLSLPPSNRGS